MKFSCSSLSCNYFYLGSQLNHLHSNLHIHVKFLTSQNINWKVIQNKYQKLVHIMKIRRFRGKREELYKDLIHSGRHKIF